jgi:hypothetical protein
MSDSGRGIGKDRACNDPMCTDDIKRNIKMYIWICIANDIIMYIWICISNNIRRYIWICISICIERRVAGVRGA